MMKKYLHLLMFVLMLPLTATATEVESFVDDNFDFTKVQTVYVVPFDLGRNPAYASEQAENNSLPNYTYFTQLTTQQLITATQQSPESDSNEFLPAMWPQAYVILLQEAREQADVIIFTDIIRYSSPPARVEEIRFTPPDPIKTSENRTVYDNNMGMQKTQLTSVPVFLPEGDFPVLRLYAVSAEDLNVPIMSSYYKLDTAENIPYSTYIDTFVNDLAAKIVK